MLACEKKVCGADSCDKWRSSRRRCVEVRLRVSQADDGRKIFYLGYR